MDRYKEGVCEVVRLFRIFFFLSECSHVYLQFPVSLTLSLLSITQHLCLWVAVAG